MSFRIVNIVEVTLDVEAEDTIEARAEAAMVLRDIMTSENWKLLGQSDAS